MSHVQKTRTIVEIYGRTYTIVGDADKHHVRLVASMVDDKMKEIYQANKSLDTTRLAVLTAVNTMHDYLKLQADYEELLKKIEEKEEH
ncbi:MAG: cell division protein ZapA [Amphibacillus sp.]|nr:cell division protein ZapA [Amphibacillus sp.]